MKTAEKIEKLPELAPMVTDFEELYESSEWQTIQTCIQCGLCVGTCPYGEFMEYPPRRIIAMMRAGKLDDVIKSKSIVKCVQCYSCMTKCPRGIKLTEVLLSVVKGKTFETIAEMPSELQKSFENTLRYGNPMGESPKKRTEWTKRSKVPIPILSKAPKPVDVLWVVECYPSYYPRNIENTLATARWFHRLGIDFAIMGEEERCLGDCARYFGEFGLMETLIEHNTARFDKYEHKRLVTSGTHGYDALRHQYSQAGYKEPVYHVMPFLHSYLPKVKELLKKPLDHTITYHDSCCLGKHNGHIMEPRELLKAIPGVKLVEMPHNMENSLCCGGGGGGMWLDTYFKEQGMDRLSERRIKEAMSTGAEILAVACDYEVSRFEDAIKVLGYDDKLQVRDIIELLDESAGGEDSV